MMRMLQARRNIHCSGKVLKHSWQHALPAAYRGAACSPAATSRPSACTLNRAGAAHSHEVPHQVWDEYAIKLALPLQ